MGLAAKDPRFQLVPAVQECEVAIDFSWPEGSLAAAAAAAKARKAAVIGTTGFSPRQMARLKAFGRRAPIFWTPNFSPGVQILLRLVREAAGLLKDYDASICETHHKLKKDAPSGTALKIAQAAREGRGSAEPIPTASLRLGDVAGEHTLILAGPYERLELTHKAHARALFARGALDAALWLRDKKPGFYSMEDRLKHP